LALPPVVVARCADRHGRRRWAGAIEVAEPLYGAAELVEVVDDAR
jgi:hypothetical protein